RIDMLATRPRSAHKSLVEFVFIYVQIRRYVHYPFILQTNMFVVIRYCALPIGNRVVKNRLSTMRWSIIAFMTVLLAACSLNPLRWGDHGVVARGVYCGTTSQASEAHYFATRDALAEWIDHRDILAFDAGVMTDRGAIVIEMGQRPTGG